MNINNKSLKVKFSWALYDWANSAWGTVITTFIFATYFTEVIAPNNEIGSVYWGNTIAISGFIIAVLSPFMGSFADQTKSLKKLLIFFTLIYALASSALWYAMPENNLLLIVLLLVIIGQVASELAFTVYNAKIKIISNDSEYGKVSGLAWGFGYFGGLTILIIILFLFVQNDRPLFGLDKSNYEHIRICGPLVGFWIIIFSLPLFIYYKDTETKSIDFFKTLNISFKEIFKTVKEINKYTNLIKFLFDL